MVERVIGNDEVGSSILPFSTIKSDFPVKPSLNIDALVFATLQKVPSLPLVRLGCSEKSSRGRD